MKFYRSKSQYHEKSFTKSLEQIPGCLKNKSTFLNRILDNEQMIIVVWSMNGTVVWYNNYTRALSGLSENDMDGQMSVNTIIPQDIISHIKENVKSIKNGGMQFRCGCTVIAGDGREICIAWNNCVICDDGNEYILSIGTDITNFKNVQKLFDETNSDLIAANEELTAQQEELSAMNEELMAQEEELRSRFEEIKNHQEMLRKSEERYRLVVEGASDGLWDWDLITDIAYISEWWKHVIEPENLTIDNKNIENYYNSWIKKIHPGDVKRVVRNLESYISGNIPYYSSEYRIRLNNGKYIWILSKGKALWDRNGIAVRIAGSHTDITERKKNENRLKHLAYYDPLTDIPLRTIFMEKMKIAIEGAKGSGSKLAVLFIDIDNFKTINDTYGHSIGDRLLKRIAMKLKSCMRSSDIISRIGGDEFVVLIPTFIDISEIDQIAKRIMELSKQPMNINGRKLFITISVGVAVYPDNGREGSSLLKKADAAMYIAKERGKNGLQYFNDSMESQFKLHCVIKRDLKFAIGNRELFLLYQPLINVKTKRVVCLEALLRWNHPGKGIISPLDFIPVAENTKHIIPVGEWVLRNACQQLKEWYEKGYTGFRLSVNVSAIQLQQTGFAENVGEIIRETGLLPGDIELEITESVLIESSETVLGNLECLKRQGVRISIDDFGIGYSRLEYLQSLTISNLKIDKSFISNIKVDVNKAIIDAVISLAHKIKVDVTAEGVETKEQFDYLKRKRCDIVQGYYFSKPVLPEAAVEIFKFQK